MGKSTLSAGYAIGISYRVGQQNGHSDSSGVT